MDSNQQVDHVAIGVSFPLSDQDRNQDIACQQSASVKKKGRYTWPADWNANFPGFCSLINDNQPRNGSLTLPLSAGPNALTHRSLKIKNRFANPWPSWEFPSVLDKVRFVSIKRHKLEGKDLERELPILKVDSAKLANPPENGVTVTWIGHATMLVQLDGVTVLTDPVFSERASPVGWSGPKRYRKAACTVEELPKIDAVVISHNHYDHLDYESVKKLKRRFGDNLQWFVPAGLKEWMNSSGCYNVVEQDWWEETKLKIKESVTFAFTPTQHWCKRTAFDDNKVLWGSWCVMGPSSKFYFSGDTGYCPAFKQIGNKYGPFDLAAIPIGAYEPRWFMKSQHINPEEAVKLHQELKAKKSVAMHWGTFNLSAEPILKPREQLKIELEKANIPLEDFFTMKHGDTIRLD